MLYPSPAKPRGKKPAPKGKPINWDKVKKGDSFGPGSAPAISGKAFTVKASIDGDGDGVILAHGGSAVGYSLYRKAGKAIFAVRTGGDAIERVSVDAPGKANVVATLAKNGEISLAVNDGTPAKGKAALIRNHPQESFDVGHDAKIPVDGDAPGPFKGSITNVRVDLK